MDDSGAEWVINVPVTAQVPPPSCSCGPRAPRAGCAAARSSGACWGAWHGAWPAVIKPPFDDGRPASHELFAVAERDLTRTPQPALAAALRQGGVVQVRRRPSAVRPATPPAAGQGGASGRRSESLDRCGCQELVPHGGVVYKLYCVGGRCKVPPPPPPVLIGHAASL